MKWIVVLPPPPRNIRKRLGIWGDYYMWAHDDSLLLLLFFNIKHVVLLSPLRRSIAIVGIPSSVCLGVFIISPLCVCVVFAHASPSLNIDPWYCTWLPIFVFPSSHTNIFLWRAVKRQLQTSTATTTTRGQHHVVSLISFLHSNDKEEEGCNPWPVYETL